MQRGFLASVADSGVVQRPLQAARGAYIEALARTAVLRRHSRPRVLCLDLHVGLFPDLREELAAQGVDVTYISLSRHNSITRRLFRRSDLVRHVNARSWRSMDDSLIHAFQDHYGSLLRSYDGFVACFSPTFAELYRSLGKPLLVMSATRYEAPYSARRPDWARFDRFLQEEARSGRLHLAANNRGDRDYLTHFTGLIPEYVPSVCDWLPPGPMSGLRLVATRDPRLAGQAAAVTGGSWVNVNSLPPAFVGGRRAHLGAAEAVFVDPHNISLMLLFELATAGVPVVVPSRRFATELGDTFSSTLSELSWFQVERLSVRGLDAADPNNYESPLFRDWWLDRADLYDEWLMPNVRVVDDWDGLPRAHQAIERPTRRVISDRNERLMARRREFVSRFVEAL